MNRVSFVICERLHENGKAEASILSRFENNQLIFVNGDPGCFSYDNVLRFSYDAALLIVNLFWEENKTYLGIAIIETDYPNEIDYSYVEYGKEKNMEVKMNREK